MQASSPSPPRAIIVTGPTAAGKTRLAIALAKAFAGDVISADSRQVYVGMDIGTGKDLADYGHGEDAVRHHLIDVVAPQDDFHLFSYLKLAWAAIADCQSRGRLPIICGGTPLYIQAMLRGYDPLGGGKPDQALRQKLADKSPAELIAILKQCATSELIARTDLGQKRRIIRAIEIARQQRRDAPSPRLHQALIIAPFYPRSSVHQRIAERLDQRLSHGLIEEVQALQQQGISWERLDWFGLEYRYVALYLQQKLSREDMREQLLIHIRQFAKRQDIWFRKLERKGNVIHWLEEPRLAQAVELVQRWRNLQPLPKPNITLATTLYGPKTQ
jgi:tRNA dimethylallyltransferase